VTRCRQTAAKRPLRGVGGEPSTAFDLRFCQSGCRDLNPGSLVPQLRPGHPG